MSKQAKIIVILLVLLLGVTFYLLIDNLRGSNKTNELAINQPEVEKKETISHDQLVVNYKSGLQPVANDFAKLLAAAEKQTTTTNNDDLLAKTATLKTKLEELVVPTEYKDLHLNIFLSVISLEDYLTNKNRQAIEKSKKLWQEIITNNDWLKP